MSSLNKREMAAITAQVPASGDAMVDALIRASLRLRTATQLLEGLLASGEAIGWEPEFAAIEALKRADALFAAVDSKPDAQS